MNDQPRLSIWDRSPIVRTIRGRLTWRDIRHELIILGWTATIIVLLYGVEDWYGRHVWNKYRRALEARGEQLDPTAFIPKPVPDNQNFAATPLIKSWFVEESSPRKKLWWDNYYSQVDGKIGSLKSWEEGGNRHFLDLVAWGMAFDAVRSGNVKSSQRFESDKLDLESRAKAAPSVLDGLKTNEAVFTELRIASQRPYSRYPIVYDLELPWGGIRLHHLYYIIGVAGRLQLKACAELAAGQSENALEDVRLMLYLADSVKDEPTLYCSLLRIDNFTQIAIQPVWEGLAEHAWSDAQLQELQSRFQQYNFITDLKWSLDAERAWGGLAAELVRKKGFGFFMALGIQESVQGQFAPNISVKAIGLLVPHGWYYQERLNYCRLFELLFGGTFDTAKKRVSPSRIQSNDRELDRAFVGGPTPISDFLIGHRAIAEMMLPGLGGVTRRACHRAGHCRSGCNRLRAGTIPACQWTIPRKTRSACAQVHRAVAQQRHWR